MTTHEKYMDRCLQLARIGLAAAMPNPSVGAVIVYKDTIIGEGFTSAYGGAHAEVNAINSVENQELLQQSTLYVSLEPCSHHGKTPPCSDLIITKKIPRVVIGCIDTFAEVSGKGIKKLQDHGIEVTLGVLEEQCRESHKRFFAYHEKKRPYVILKWAASADGFIAPLHKEELKPVWISNIYSRQLTHKWRSEEQAILVGTQTIIDDNPSLTVRSWKGRNPIRMYIDRDLKISSAYAITDDFASTICITAQSETPIDTVSYEKIDFETAVIPQIMDICYKRQIQSIIIEGGLQTLQAFIQANIWDEARIFESNIVLNNGIKAPLIRTYKSRTVESVAEDRLLLLKNN